MKEISLTRGLVTFVDDDDFESLSLFRWYATSERYVARIAPDPMRPGKRTHYPMHRVIMGLGRGDKRQIDHIDGNTLNNQKANLRICTVAENLRNRGTHRTNTSGFKGVSRGSKNSWRAQIEHAGKQYKLGSFPSPELAHEFYCLAADMLHGEFSNHG